MSTQIVFAAYKPHAGKEDQLEGLIKQHVPILRDLELITDRPSLTVKSKDGTYMEIIEWRDVRAADTAHEHPAVAKVWEAMAKISDFISLKQLPESEKPFSHFEVAKV